MQKERILKWIPLVVLLLLVASLFSLTASAATTLTLLNGDLTITDSVGTGTESSGTVTITAQGSFLSKKTNTVTLVNKTNSTATLSFDYTVSNADSHTLPANSGTYSVTLNAGASTSFTITSKALNRTVTLKISNLSLVEAQSSSSITFAYDDSLGSVTVDGSAVSNGSTASIPLSGAELNATAKAGSTFLGWIDGDNKWLSTAASYTLTPTEDMSVTAVFANTSTAWFLAGGDHLYDDLNDAASYAATAGTKTVILLNSGTLAAGTYTIPSGVTLLIPFDASNTLYTTAPGIVETYTKPTAYRTLTMSEGANIIVNGALSVSGKQSAKFGENGLVTGPVGFINTEAGSSISVENGGALYVWGYITGSGEVVAKNGAYVYEDFQFEDWRGGDQATGMKNEVFPISQFYIQNIEVPLTLEAGAKEYGYASIKVTLLGIQKASPFLFGNSNALFEISEGSITKRYDGTKDRLIIDINGSVNLKTLEMKLGVYGINSKNYDLMLNGNISINVHNGADVTISGDIAAIPGVELTVDEGASVTVASGVNLYIYDSDTWGTYCSSSNQTVMPLKYAPGRTYTRTEKDLKDVSILINGEVDARGAFIYTTEGGANIHSEGGGIIKINGAGTQKVTYQVIQAADPDNSTYVEIPITPAMLKNGNGTFVETSSYGSGTYKYIGGYWHLGEDHTYNWDSVLNDTGTKCINHLCCDFCTDLLAKVDLQYRLDDYIWMNAVVTLENGVTGEITPDSGIELVDLKNGTYYLVRKVVAKELTTDFAAGLAIDGIAKPFTIQLGFAAFDATLPDNHVHKPLVAKMKSYGIAAKAYFDYKALVDANQSTDDIEAPKEVLSLPSGVENALNSKDKYYGTDANYGYYLNTQGANILFGERLAMVVNFKMVQTGDTDKNAIDLKTHFGNSLVKVGLLVSESTVSYANDPILSFGADGVTSYVIYGGHDVTYDPSVPDPDVTGDEITIDTDKRDYTNMSISFDLTTEDYLSRFQFRPYVIYLDGNGQQQILYGRQFYYGLEDYIVRQYAADSQELGQQLVNNLLVTTWDYAEAAAAAFPG